jgi:SAM-dependent methyltransferase
MPAPSYRELLDREAAHWSGTSRGLREPQLWDDPALFEIFFGAEWRGFLAAILAGGRDVLELGCGDGLLACELAVRGVAVTGVDLSPDRIGRARRRAAGITGVRPEFLVGDLNTMALPRTPVDVVVAHDALHHIVELGPLLDRVHGALRPGGRLVVMEYTGMGRARRVAAAAFAALLPTHLSYAEKWALRRRLPAFLATEAEKRAALAAGGGPALHPDSPFEEVSQEGLLPAIEARFRILRLNTFNPFWFYLAPKLRIPAGARVRTARMLRGWDDLLVRTRIARGAYLWLEAVPR